MTQFLTWLMMVTGPLYLFLEGIKMDDNFLIYSSYAIYGILIFVGISAYDKFVIKTLIQKQKEENILAQSPVPEWVNFFAKIISVFTLIYFESYFMGLLLLIASYGNYKLFGVILPQIKIGGKE